MPLVKFLSFSDFKIEASSEPLKYISITFVFVLEIITFYFFITTMMGDPGIVKIPLNDENENKPGKIARF